MAKQSAYLQKIRKQNAYKDHQRMLFTLQYAEDAAMLACADVFGMGPERAKRFGEAFTQHVHDISELIHVDSQSDKDCEYARTKIDQRLQQICGKYFVPWKQRYDFSEKG